MERIEKQEYLNYMTLYFKYEIMRVYYDFVLYFDTCSYFDKLDIVSNADSIVV